MVPFCSLRFSFDCSLEFRRSGTHVEPTGDKAMPTENLTDRKIASLKPAKERTEYWDDGTPGFGLRVSPEGTKTFFLMYRFAGLRRRLKLGRYPEVPLFEARKNAKKALATVSEGKDPVQEKKANEAGIRFPQRQGNHKIPRPVIPAWNSGRWPGAGEPGPCLSAQNLQLGDQGRDR